MHRAISSIQSEFSVVYFNFSEMIGDMLKLENLRSFITVANAGNISDAANILGRTPSAVSMTLKQLEQSIGGPLFETDRKNALTALGQYTLETAQVQIHGFDTAVKAIRAFAGNSIGLLSIASVPSVAINLIPDLLPEFVVNRPGVEIELLDADSRSVASMVENGVSELGIAGAPTAAAHLSFTPLFSDRFRVVFAQNSDLNAIDRPLAWPDLQSEQFIRNEASDTIQLPELRGQYFQANMVVRNVTSLLAMVNAGMGITLLPALATTNLPGGLTARDIDFRGATRVVGLIKRKGPTLSPVATAFCHHIKTAIPSSAAHLNLRSLT